MPVAKNPAQEDFDSLHGKLRDGKFELAAYKFHYAAHSLDVITEVLEKQTELLAHMLDKPNTCGSTIKVEPEVYWPRLRDDGPGGEEVEEFCGKLEEVCGLANNGTGMSDRETLVALKTCLHCFLFFSFLSFPLLPSFPSLSFPSLPFPFLAFSFLSLPSLSFSLLSFPSLSFPFVSFPKKFVGLRTMEQG